MARMPRQTHHARPMRRPHEAGRVPRPRPTAEGVGPGRARTRAPQRGPSGGERSLIAEPDRRVYASAQVSRLATFGQNGAVGPPSDAILKLAGRFRVWNR
jgi:hypothetical protein